jgi:predicted MPP superfamily phosphohydrolase
MYHARPMRTATFLAIAILIFAPFTIVTIRSLLRIHPRRRGTILTIAILGNLMWPFFPLLRSMTPFFRVVRAVLGPLWFSWASFAILYTALIIILGILYGMRRLGRNAPPFAAFARWPSRLFLMIGAAAIVVGVYHALVPLRVERVPIIISGLPAEAEGMRIALLSDLHVGLFTRPSRLDKIFATTRALDPHVVLLLGDLIDDDPYFVPKLLKGTRVLAPDTPLLAVLGNHEIYGDPVQVIKSLAGSRIRLLVNEAVEQRSIAFVGAGEPAAGQMNEHRELGPDVARAMKGVRAGALPVLFAHQPRLFDDAIQRGIPLTLAGHTHGGQCGIRPLGWSLAGVFLKRHMGHYVEGLAQLYINTGTGYWLVPFRLGMTPEITLIELRRRAE